MAELIDSVVYTFDIPDYQDIEAINNMVMEHFTTPRRGFQWVIRVEPIVERADGVFLEIGLELLTTRVDGIKSQVTIKLIFGDEDHQQSIIGEGLMRIRGELQQFRAIFPVVLGEPGTRVQDALRVPKYRQQGNRSVVRMSVQVDVYKDPLVITL